MCRLRNIAIPYYQEREREREREATGETDRQKDRHKADRQSPDKVIFALQVTQT